MSSVQSSLPTPILPYYHPSQVFLESSASQRYIDEFLLLSHPEGGYFVETDRDPLRVPNPFLQGPKRTKATATSEDDSSRNASTTIYYFLTPKNPTGVFHRNKGRTVHTLHRGRGRYVVIHADEVEEGKSTKARVETFVVGQNIAKGEKLQWIVEGGKFKASFLLPDEDNGTDSSGLLISETVVPGFEFADHDFATPEELHNLVQADQEKELAWLLRGSPESKRSDR